MRDRFAPSLRISAKRRIGSTAVSLALVAAMACAGATIAHAGPRPQGGQLFGTVQVTPAVTEPLKVVVYDPSGAEAITIDVDSAGKYSTAISLGAYEITARLAESSQSVTVKCDRVKKLVAPGPASSLDIACTSSVTAPADAQRR